MHAAAEAHTGAGPLRQQEHTQQQQQGQHQQGGSKGGRDWAMGVGAMQVIAKFLYVSEKRTSHRA